MRSNQDEVLNVLNVMCRVENILRIRIVTIDRDKDIDMVLYPYRAYKIIYVTEYGIEEAMGVLLDIIPDYKLERCNGQHHKNNYTLKIDCSKDGRSDVRKIFVRSIRNIEDITPSEEGQQICNNDIYFEEIDNINTDNNQSNNLDITTREPSK